MMTVPQRLTCVQGEDIDEQVKTFLQDDSEDLGRETGFVQRLRSISAAQFAQTLIFGWLSNPNASYTQLQQVLAMVGSEASAQALEQRMNERGADFLLGLLYALMGLCAETDGLLSGLLARFVGVYAQDGTVISLPQQMAPLYHGFGPDGQKGERSGLRVQVRLNLSSGALQGRWLQAAASSERSGPGSPDPTSLPQGSLLLTDSGYVTLASMKAARQQGRHWLTHARADWLLTDARGVVCTLPQWVSLHEHEEVIDEWVWLGKQKNQQQAVRLIAFRVSPQTAARRLQEANKSCQTRPKGSRRDVGVGKPHQRPSIDGRHRKRVSTKRLALRDWTLLLTNVPVDLLSAAEARVLARCRWQIELLWRLWKERGQVDIWRSQKPMRILCEIYAKLMGLIIQHWLILRACWQQPHRSLVKASYAVQSLALTYLLSLSGPVTTQRVGQFLRQAMRRSCLTTHRHRFTTSQLVQDPCRVMT